jgi:gamma-glutamyltranspeptidase/glutathione hydrolase
VTASDLAAYEVVERTPLEVPWRGRRVLTNPSPSFGGTLIAATLRRLSAVDLPAGDPGWTAALLGACADVDRDRRRILAGDDPWADGPTTPVDPDLRGTTRGTTHVSVWDGEGGAASMTMSNGECSGDVIPGTGILANNILGEDDLHPDGFHAAPPGVRVSSMMSPTMVVGPTGATEVVVGSGGSKRIRSAVLQALLNLVVHGHDPRTAVEAARVHWDVDHVEAEPGLDPAVLAAVRDLALGSDGDPTLPPPPPVNLWPERSVFFGGAHLVVPGVGAAGDPRRDGASADL